ncbi:S9 family peptidase [Olivibacter sp. SDN3]|uniref:alpha/beta hydrolase family protein n=1 Tax=Olivibacter sp. SDN3 TaxID=2764720 RepID=UPI001651030C|nr:prolyl oligopeptidase family serine peptidase [Olivibacter sp. SDN3]QNL49082.1 S9 family peptidase [Olivibacter sp. SDN3]
MRKIYLASVALSLTFANVCAQKKPLDHSVYDSWQGISSAKVSNNAQFVLYSVTPQEGDAMLSINSTDGEILWNIPRGENGTFTDDSKYAIASITPPFALVRQAKIKKKKAEEMPKDSLAIISLTSNEVFKVANVSKYKLPLASTDHVAYIVESKDTTKIEETADSKARNSKKKDKKDSYGTLHLRSLETGEEKTFEHVNDFYFDDKGAVLAFVKKGRDSAGKSSSTDTDAGLFLYLIKEKILKQISRGKGNYTNLAFDETGNQLAFTAEKNHEKALQKPYNLYYYTPEKDTASILANVSSTGMPLNWNVSGDGDVFFSKSGEKLYFGIAPIPPIKDTTIVDFEVANVDVWSWKDDYLQPQQLVNLQKDLTKSYLAVVSPRHGGSVVPLGSEEIPDIHTTDHADNGYVLGNSNYGKRISAQWEGGTAQDFYVISTLDGSRKKIAENIYGYASISPTGKFIIWYDLETQQWNSYEISNNRSRVLNSELPVSFSDEENDSPTFARPYGIAGWSADDAEVLIYDKYDIWSFNPAGDDRKLLTNGAGRSNQITFRYEDIAPKIGIQKKQKSIIIDLKNPLLVSAFDHKNKERGWYNTNPRNKRDPKEIAMGPYMYNQISASENSKIYIYTKENYQAPPDLYSSSNFKNENKLSNINPQQQQYNWGTAELVKWTTPSGYEATGVLYKPEDFNEANKYPLIAYFYEKLSDGLHQYISPAPTPSRLNISYFVSNGYLVFAPDISYEIGHPGKSAEEYVNSGVGELSKFPWVDENHIGIQGQSWGGYQVSHLITRTDMYAAAWAGAPVVNMTSAYGGIRWASGMNRQFQYEKTQSRIGQDLWEGYDLFIENSPLFHLRSVNTPVVIMANDNDGAVPWYQGIEMFTALRRLGKPVWMLNYNGEEHNLVKRQNRKDIQIREQQFFDHFLKGKPAPVWLDKGIPATLKGIDWGFDLIDELK